MYIRRKAFSVAIDEATGEEKLFSTTEVMSEESYLEKLYSESEKKDEGDKKKSHSAVKGAALAVGSTAANVGLTSRMKLDKEGNRLFKSTKKADKKLAKEHEKISEILKKEAEAQGTKVTETPFGQNSHYVSKNLHKLNKKLGNSLEEAGKAGDSILTGDRADLLAHELGHSKHYQGRSGSKVGKLAHRLHPISQIGTASPIGWGASFANGAVSGKNAVKAEREGKKESKWNKARAVAVPVAVGAPLLVAEGAASRKGMKLLKKAGASKELLKDSRKNLLKAHGTYTSAVGINAGIGELGRAAGKSYERKKDKKKNGK